MRFLNVILALTFLVSCSDSGSGTDPNNPDARLLASQDATTLADVHILDWTPPPPPEPELTREERCAQTPIQEVQAYCSCFENCIK